MATLAKKIEVEAKTREMLKAADTPPPDRVEYGVGCIRLFWRDSKTCLVVDIDEDSEIDEEVEIEQS